jgi:Glycosyltransferase family 87
MNDARLAALLSLAMLAVIAFGTVAAEHWETDFLSFYAGSQLAGTPHLYSVAHVQAIQAPLERHPHEVRAYIRPPFYAALTWPLGRLPYRAAHVIWQILNLAALAAFIWLWSPGARSFPLCCFCIPVWASLACGQDMPLLLALLAASVFLLGRRRPFAAGLLLALCGVKFHLFLLLPLVIFRRKLWRYAAGLAAGAAALLAISFALGGWNWPLQYYHLLRLNERYQNSQSYMANLNGLFHGVPHALLWIALGSAAVAAAVWYVIPRVSLPAAMALALCGGLLVSPHTFIYDLGFLLPLLALERHAATLSVVVSAATLAITLPATAFLGQLALLGLFGAAVYSAGRTEGAVPMALGEPV